MADLVLYFAASVALASAIAAVTLSAPRALWLKVGAIATAGVLMVAIYLGLNGMMSRPKPMSLEWYRASAEDANVIAATMIEGEAIYLWLRVPQDSEPRSYRMPWSEEAARQLAEAQHAAESNGREVMMRKPFQSMQGAERPIFYPEPQPPLPAKQADGR